MLLLGKDLYRALLREARALPDSTTILHYESLIRSSFRLPLAPESSAAPLRRVQGAQRLLRQLQAANDGYLHSLTRVLETTYARRGPGKHALLRPFILSPTTLPPSSHSFSSSLSALLTSSISHTTRPPNPSQLVSPPSLPPRAHPASEEARLLGPLTPQRIRAIRRRYWSSQTAKLRAPLAVQVRGAADGQLVRSAGVASGVLHKAGLGGVDVEGGWRRLEELEAKSRVAEEAKPRVPRRLQTLDERAAKGPTPRSPKLQEEKNARILSPSSKNSKWHLPKTISPRLLRRRFAHILDNSPVLTVVEGKGDGGPKGFEVSKSSWAKGGMGHAGTMSEEDLWWLNMDDVASGGGTAERKGKSAASPPICSHPLSSLILIPIDPHQAFENSRMHLTPDPALEPDISSASWKGAPPNRTLRFPPEILIPIIKKCALVLDSTSTHQDVTDRNLQLGQLGLVSRDFQEATYFILYGDLRITWLARNVFKLARSFAANTNLPLLVRRFEAVGVDVDVWTRDRAIKILYDGDEEQAEDDSEEVLRKVGKPAWIAAGHDAWELAWELEHDELGITELVYCLSVHASLYFLPSSLAHLTMTRFQCSNSTIVEVLLRVEPQSLDITVEGPGWASTIAEHLTSLTSLILHAQPNPYNDEDSTAVDFHLLAYALSSSATLQHLELDFGSLDIPSSLFFSLPSSLSSLVINQRASSPYAVFEHINFALFALSRSKKATTHRPLRFVVRALWPTDTKWEEVARQLEEAFAAVGVCLLLQ